MTTTIWLPRNQGAISSPKPATAVVAQSPLAELMTLLHIIENPNHHGPLVDKVETFKNRLGADLLRDLDRYSIMWRRYRTRFLLPTSMIEGNLTEEIEAICQLPIDRFIQCVLWTLNGRARDFSGDASLLTDAEFRDRLLAHVHICCQSSLPIVHCLTDDPFKLRDDFVRVIAEVGEIFSSEIWPHISGVIAAHVNSCRRRQETLGLVALLSSLPSAVVVDDKAIQLQRRLVDEIYLGETQLLLIPSIFTWPHVQVKTEQGYMPVIQHPVREFYQTAGGETGLADVQRRLAALSDSVRFDICRTLARSPATTSNLAERVGLAAPHVSRHLKVLLQAGLVSRMQSGRFVIYDFNGSSIVDLGPELLAEFLR